MAIVDGYVTLPEVQAYARNATAAREEDIEDIVTAVSRSIEDHCGLRDRPRRFLPLGTAEEPVDRTFVLQPSGTLIDTGDLVSITTIAGDDGDGTFGVDVGGARLLPLNNDTQVPPRPFTSIELLEVPPPEVTHVRISGVWCWAEVPAAVKRACLIQVARLIDRPNSPLGLAGGFGEFGAMRVFGDGWDQDAANLLERYREREFGIA